VFLNKKIKAQLLRFFMFNAGRFEILSQLNKKEIKIL